VSRDDIYFNPPDSYVRQKPDWTKDLEAHVAAYLRKGGTIRQCENGESFYAKHYEAGNKHAFVINAMRASRLAKK
jgi:hypothetical protein